MMPTLTQAAVIQSVRAADSDGAERHCQLGLQEAAAAKDSSTGTPAAAAAAPGARGSNISSGE
jgi:hypothetical protein